MAINNSNPSTSQTILSAASKIISEKGFMGCSLSDIAQEAGVREPTIYQYFKGKEDLLFSASENHMNDYLAFLDEQLQGIVGAYNRLRKLVWAHLRYSDINKEYITLIIFECRANPNFYQSGAYKLIRQYAGLLLSILEEGQKEKVFRKGLNLKLLRDVIFGFLDYEAITCLVTHEIGEAAGDHGEVMRLIEGMITAGGEDEAEPTEKRQRILRAAVTAFADRGYFNATISEIAKSAGVAEGTVYEYFKNKEDLLLAVPEEHFQDHLKQVEKTFDIGNPLRKLKIFMEYHFYMYLNEKKFLLVFLNLIQLNRRFYQSRAYDSLKSYWRVLEKLVQEAIDDGKASAHFNIRLFRNMFLGAFTHMALRWFVIEPMQKIDKVFEIQDVTQMLIDVIVNSCEWNGAQAAQGSTRYPGQESEGS